MTIRSVVGWYIPWLAFLDLDYTQSKLDLIIPKDTEPIRFRDAAFEGYFSFNRPDGFLFKNLKTFFIRAFDWANESKSEESFHRPKQHYVEHLAVYYWWGIDPLSDGNCLIKKIFTIGNVKLRSHSIEFIGRSLETLLPVDPEGSEALKRLQELLEWRLKNIGESVLERIEIQEELKEFGWWFTYAQMDKKWLLDRLFDILSMTDGQIEWTHEVLKRLIDFVLVDPLKVARVIEMIIKADHSPWNVEYWKDHLSSLFSAIKDSNDEDAWDICKAVINFIGELGFRGFRSFLNSEPLRR